MVNSVDLKHSCFRLMALWSRPVRGGSSTAVQAWQPCPLREPSPSHPILL